MPKHNDQQIEILEEKLREATENLKEATDRVQKLLWEIYRLKQERLL